MIYLSADIEADGPIPGEYSMLSFGVAAFDESGKLLSTFTRNLFQLPNAKQDEDTMAFWAKNEKAYNATRVNAIDPQIAMLEFVDWCKELGDNFVLFGYPVTYDFMFLYWYTRKFTPESPFGFSGLDIKTLAWDRLGCSYKRATKKHFPKRWFKGIDIPHNHIALDDAIEQGIIFFNIIKDKDHGH